MQNGFRVRNGGLKSGIELGLGFKSAAPFLSLPDFALCLTGIFKPVIHKLSSLP